MSRNCIKCWLLNGVSTSTIIEVELTSHGRTSQKHVCEPCYERQEITPLNNQNFLLYRHLPNNGLDYYDKDKA